MLSLAQSARLFMRAKHLKSRYSSLVSIRLFVSVNIDETYFIIGTEAETKVALEKSLKKLTLEAIW